MGKRLLDRQASLLDYLTSGDAIFADAGRAPLPRPLRGVDPRLLRLEARFSHDKRMEKVMAMFPRTFELLGDRQEAIVRQFVRTCPPVDISRISNARQFHDFVVWRWQRETPDPPYLKDVAACEFACARVRLAREELDEATERAQGAERGPALRRRREVDLVRCSHDIRAIFEGDAQGADPPRRDTALAVVLPPDDDEPRVCEVHPAISDLLESLGDWTDPAALGLTAEHDPLIRDLAEHHLIEVRR